MNYYLLQIKEIQQLLNTSNNGLSTVQAEERLKEFGKNELTEKAKKSIWILLLQQLKNVMIIILLIAAVVSVAIGDIKDAIVILIIVLLNSIIGFVQEYKAEKAMAALKKMATSVTNVRRNGKVIQIASTEIVKGDLILLEAGNVVPADIRLTECHSLQIEEASLTGESQSVEKITTALTEENIPLGDKKNMAFKSTIVAYGRGEGIVGNSLFHLPKQG